MCGLVFLSALLICNGAGSLASRLTGSLTVAAAALFSRLLEVSLVDSLDMLHGVIPPIFIFYIITHFLYVYINIQ